MAGERTIDAGTPESRQMAECVRRAVRCTEALNALPYDDRERIAAAWSELTGQPRRPDPSPDPAGVQRLRPEPPHRPQRLREPGLPARRHRRDELGDDVMLGPGVRIISSGHPLDPALRRRQVTASPIVVGRNVWIGAGAPSSKASRSATTPWWPPTPLSRVTSHPQSSSRASRRGW
jgi:hypothetical protein